MSIDLTGRRFCDCCGRTMAKAWRIEPRDGKDYEFCSTCYKREFRPRTCDTCGKTSRYRPTGFAPWSCPHCDRQSRRCIRCDKPAPEAGILIQGKAVCPACVWAFREPEPCAQCGSLSRRLTTAPSHGITERICERCRQRLTNRTCSICRRYRPVAGMTDDNKPYCAACRPGAEQRHRCPQCREWVPGDGQGTCRPCSIRTRVMQQTELFAPILQQAWARGCFRDFGTWLTRRNPVRDTFPGFIGHHQVFFVRLDVEFSALELVTADTLLARFTVSDLRKHVLPMTFLAEHAGIQVSPEAKSDSVEVDRIAAIVQRSASEPWGEVVGAYAEHLRVSNVPTRTRRLYLSAAESFARGAGIPTTGTCTTEDLARHLRAIPGARTGLFRFVTFLRKVRHLDISMPPRERPLRGYPEVIDDLVAVMQREPASISPREMARIDLVLAKAFGMSRAAFVAIPWLMERSGEALTFVAPDERVEIPTELHALVTAWYARRAPAVDASTLSEPPPSSSA